MSNQRYISDSLRKKKKKVKKIKIYLWAIFSFLCIVGFLYVLTIPAFQIQEVKVTGTMFVDKSEIEQKTNTLLDRKFLGFIPNRNIFLFSKHELEELLKQNPAIISAKIRKDFFHILTIDVKEHEKEMIYCTTLEKTECFYLNKDGFVYAPVKGFIIPEQEIIIYNEKEVKKLQDTFIQKEVYVDISLFVKNLARQEIKIKEVYIKADSTVEFVSWENTRFITSIFDEYKKDFANLIALFEKQAITKEQLQNIEYIDLRFGNKVFYKNKTN
ncbi:MAG: hypothetical protein RLY49_525 [Candidatus Parcubacteria bacterium]|jgi:hypothetical protein